MAEDHDIVQYSLTVYRLEYRTLAKYVLRADLYKANEIGTVHTTMPIVTDSKSVLRLMMTLYGLKFEKGAKLDVVRKPVAFGHVLSQIAYVSISVVPM